MNWFKENLGEVTGASHPRIGRAYLFGERAPRELFKDYGINIRMLEPDQPASLYHSENAEETFLVLGGDCRVLIDDEWMELRQWDFVHCPPGTHQRETSDPRDAWLQAGLSFDDFTPAEFPWPPA